MENETQTNEKESMQTVYEVSYILLPSLALEQVPAKASSLKEMIEKAGGAVVSFEDPVLIDLAYGMTKVVQTIRHKAMTGYFGWVKFEQSAEGIEGVKKAFDAHPEVLRYLIIKTVRENTLLNGKMMFREDAAGKDGNEDGVETVPEEVASPEEIDKSIDSLVIA